MTTNLISDPISGAVRTSTHPAPVRAGSEPDGAVDPVLDTAGVIPRRLIGKAPSAPPARLAGGAPAYVSVVAGGRDHVTVTVRGWLDRIGVARLRTTLAGLRTAGTPRLFLDVSGLSGWDRALPRALAWARIQLHGNGQELILTGAAARLCTEIDQAHHTLGLPLFRGPYPGQPAYRPETADQP
ncbi:MAG: hypothetical protein J2P19_00630 [Pseudonocardia sp.]|nr:hypothetical protein [Pseudonocardia sp.]